MSKEQFFNERAKNWDEISKNDMTKVDMLTRLLLIQERDTILDVGTGTGVLLPVLSRYTRGENITAIDIAEDMIAVARRKFGDLGCSFILGDAVTYPFRPESFDVIVCYSVFPHIDDKPGMIKNLMAALKNGGLLAILHSCSKERINGVHVHAHRDISLDSLPPAETVAALMRKLGMKPEAVIDNSEMYAVCARHICRNASF
ncbi:MAG: class I SAM-dependent methyltransferase [Spirochaetaceae bacterium]|jgi:demethylmenaquinone methyltransferase/2-methoxy-6-polyprenyl-1,4-benzoquinol methylase|nr:class I SAM-dependent methyltransferase [Spirochaetaceae bacterium]